MRTVPWISAVGLLLLTACASTTQPADPGASLPADYRQACAVSARAGQPAAPLAHWWTGFDDAALHGVIERALQSNPTLQQAQARAQTQLALASGEAGRSLPQLGLSVGVADVGQSLLDPVPRLGQAIPGFERHFVQKQAGVGAQWAIDPAGGLQAASAQADALAQATLAQVEAVRSALAAEVATTYLALRSQQERLTLSEGQVRVQERLVGLISRRVSHGLAAARELDAAQAALEGVRAAVPGLRLAVESSLVRLEGLAGAAPGSLRPALIQPAALPRPPGVDLSASPASLLRLRPDLLAAEWRWAAARSGVEVSLAEYYPRLSLNALLGWSSSVPGRWLGGDARTHEVALGLRWRLFDFGRIDAEVAAARGREAESLAAYRGAVWQAAGEVETALTQVLEEAARRDASARQSQHLRQARERAHRAYAEGATSLLEVLDLERQQLAAEDQQAQAGAAVAQATVQSFRALGGGWQPRPAPASAAADTPQPRACGGSVASVSTLELP